MKITLYSNDCPRCKVLEKKLEQSEIEFVLNKDLDTLLEVANSHNFQSAPILQIDDNYLDFAGANQFINNFDAKNDTHPHLNLS